MSFNVELYMNYDVSPTISGNNLMPIFICDVNSKICLTANTTNYSTFWIARFFIETRDGGRFK